MKNTKFINQLQETGKILELHRKYEEGIIKEEELTEEEKEKLIKLYKEQIASLKIEIENNDRKIEYYKKEMLEEIKKKKTETP